MIFIADTHFSKFPAKNRTVVSRLQRLKQIHPAEHLVVVGDVADDALQAQYEEAKQALWPWQGDCTVLPGNHDHGLRGLCYELPATKRFKEFTEALGSYSQFMEIDNTGEARIMGVDTTPHTYSLFDLACGLVEEEDLHKISRFAKSQGRTVVALHHDPISSNPLEKLLNWQELLRETYGKVDLLVSGHSHTEGGHVWTAPRGDKYTKVLNVASLRYNNSGVAWLYRNGELTEVLL